MILQRDKHSFCDNCVCTYGNDKDCMYCEYYIVTQEYLREGEEVNANPHERKASRE